MIRPATKAIEATFKEKDLKYTIHEIDDASLLEVSFGLDSFSYDLVFISPDDDTDVETISTLLCVPEEKRQSILPVLNQINHKYRYFTFYMAEDGSVRARFTFLPASTPMELVGEMAFELLVRSNSIFDEVYPKLMKVIWG